MVDANIENCIGCGQCNIGCRFGSKLSMLDHVLPAAQERSTVGAHHRAVHREAHRDDGTRAEAVRCELDDGRTFRAVAGRASWCRPARSPPAACFSAAASAGAAGGSRPELQHGDTRHGRLRSKAPLDEGLQISHYAPAERPGMRIGDVVQPSRNAVAVHAGVVRRPLPEHGQYARMACGGVVVGTIPTGTFGGGSGPTSASSPGRRTWTGSSRVSS